MANVRRYMDTNASPMSWQPAVDAVHKHAGQPADEVRGMLAAELTRRGIRLSDATVDRLAQLISDRPV